MKNLFYLMLVSVLLVGLLGCGASNATEASTQTTESTVPSTTAVQEDRTVELSMPGIRAFCVSVEWETYTLSGRLFQEGDQIYFDLYDLSIGSTMAGGFVPKEIDDCQLSENGHYYIITTSTQEVIFSGLSYPSFDYYYVIYLDVELQWFWVEYVAGSTHMFYYCGNDADTLSSIRLDCRQASLPGGEYDSNGALVQDGDSSVKIEVCADGTYRLTDLVLPGCTFVLAEGGEIMEPSSDYYGYYDGERWSMYVFDNSLTSSSLYPPLSRYGFSGQVSLSESVDGISSLQTVQVTVYVSVDGQWYCVDLCRDGQHFYYAAQTPDIGPLECLCRCRLLSNTNIDWTLISWLVDSQGNALAVDEAGSISGYIIECEDEPNKIALDIEIFNLWGNNYTTDSAGYCTSRNDQSPLPYEHWYDTLYSSDQDASIPCHIALSAEEGFMIIYLSDRDQYLLLSCYGDSDPAEIFEYFEQFRSIYG